MTKPRKARVVEGKVAKVPIRRDAGFAARMAAARASHPHEGDDTYPVIVSLGDRHRVINCRDDIQWIIQCRSSVGRTPWRGVSYCRTREALLRLCWYIDECLPHDDDGKALMVVAALPEWHP